jgi:hypothetical protein
MVCVVGSVTETYPVFVSVEDPHPFVAVKETAYVPAAVY